MDTTLQENPTRTNAVLILVFVAIDIVALLLAAVPLIASIFGRIAN